MMTDADVILTAERAALDRWSNGDPSGFVELSDADVVYFDDSVARRVDGLEALTALYEKIRGKIHLDRYELINPKVQVCGDAAVLTCNFVGYAGGKAFPWNCTEVYRRTDRGWRIIHTHWSVTQHAAP